MITLLLTFIANLSLAFPPELHAVYERLEVHEFYQDNELITRPLDVWQTIASFSMVNKDLSLSKACLKYRPAMKDNGLFRVERMALEKKCDEEGVVLYELSSLFGIQFKRSPEFIITFSHKDYSTSSWTITTAKKKKELTLLDTPAKYWGETVLLLNDFEEDKVLLEDGTRCLEVLDDCSIKGESLCHQCANGSLEAPNGCLRGPRYCSSAECGTKGNPACRRGVKFQKKRVLDCREDSGFALCSGDSTPTCRGQEVWCL